MKNWIFLTLACLLGVLLFVVDAHAAEPSPATAPAPAGGAARERLSFAVIVGNNKSLGRRRPDLHYADDDAARYFDIFQAIAPGRVSLLADLDRDSARLFPTVRAVSVAPTRRALEAVGRHLARQVRAARQAGHETEVYFVFAGHGEVAEGEGFIEMADARFGSGDLKAWLRAIPFTRAHVILDSCNSFFMLGVRKPGGRHFATSEDAARALAARLPNVGVFLSTSAEGEAFEWSEIQSGIFSHLVRSGLLGAADANADGLVSYVELAAFVDTATSDVRNPNMRPHVFARGPGAADATPIARLHSMSAVRRVALGSKERTRLRVRDANGLPLLDAHTEQSASLDVVLPEAWARGATVERASSADLAAAEQYGLPESPEPVTLAALQPAPVRSAGRGPDETFQSLFAQPFGPRALASYVAEQGSRPAPVFGVSQQDTQRMELVLTQIERSERSKRYTESVGAIGFGLLIGGAGVGVLDVDSSFSSEQKRAARIGGGLLLGLGGLFVIGGTGQLLTRSTGEGAAREFRDITRESGDPTQAFAAADKRLRDLANERRAERWAAGVVGSIAMLGCATGFVWSEMSAPEGSARMAPRLGWGGGFLAGGLMIGTALLTEEPADALTTIWREDPSLNQYQPKLLLNQPTLSLARDGAFLTLSGSL